MASLFRGTAAVALTLALAACSGGGAATTAPGPTGGGGATAGSGAEATPAPTTAATAPCQDSTDPTTVNATVGDFTWGPVTAKVGDVITWTNADSAPHAVGLDDGSCKMSKNIAGGGTGSLVFSVAGSFPFHCTVHPNMKGTITITS